MIRRTLGAPLGGTTRAGQYGFDWLAWRLISPPNFGGGGGRYFPSIVVVALGEPGAPVVCCAIGNEGEHGQGCSREHQCGCFHGSISPETPIHAARRNLEA